MHATLSETVCAFRHQSHTTSTAACIKYKWSYHHYQTPDSHYDIICMINCRRLTRNWKISWFWSTFKWTWQHIQGSCSRSIQSQEFAKLEGWKMKLIEVWIVRQQLTTQIFNWRLQINRQMQTKCIAAQHSTDTELPTLYIFSWAHGNIVQWNFHIWKLTGILLTMKYQILQ